MKFASQEERYPAFVLLFIGIIIIVSAVGIIETSESKLLLSPPTCMDTDGKDAFRYEGFVSLDGPGPRTVYFDKCTSLYDVVDFYCPDSPYADALVFSTINDPLLTDTAIGDGWYPGLYKPKTLYTTVDCRGKYGDEWYCLEGKCTNEMRPTIIETFFGK